MRVCPIKQVCYRDAPDRRCAGEADEAEGWESSERREDAVLLSVPRKDRIEQSNVRFLDSNRPDSPVIIIIVVAVAGPARRPVRMSDNIPSSH
jgi:hypothetical protein